VHVEWAIPCRYAEVQAGSGATIVGAGSDLMRAAELPAAAQILFVVRFVGAPEELDGTTAHPIACRLYTPAGDLMGEQRADLTSAVTQVVPGYVADVTMPIGVVLEADEYGSYRVEFQIDDSAPLRVPFHIVEAAEAG
jgi:hypothetical protein